MALTFGPILSDAGIDLADALVIRHAYVKQHENGFSGIHADSTDQEILEYTWNQAADPQRFPSVPPRFWVVFVKEGGDQARLWSVLENRGEVTNDGERRVFDLVASEHMEDLQHRLVIEWRSPRSWWMRAATAASYAVMGIADAEPVPFPGFDHLILDYALLQAVMREHRYASWRTALSSVMGVYLITDTRDGRQYVGKADGAESIRQRWNVYAANGHGGNVELRSLNPASFRFSLLRVFDPATPASVIDAAESHFKTALDTRRHGLNRN
ncbi:GIY-YIG nuclease family protein [Leucobacter sp. CSA1]|uniref:GIY-YIG nuclease family protein n=1 Tax=Leucobacter chromiisoli TaxID=2796471 RepID=A0A934Q9J7_9MICO|nr:GIY-YIG nuclease family protein [Leucobacter chromiisoli]MBK0419139.1 GIY-YIG nuclease family protein [Leucobacter chromiisoli]